MKIVNPQTGQVRIEKRRRRYHEPGQPRELTFSCYRHYPFLLHERTRQWFREALQAARTEFGCQIWAYVLMPEHVHLLVDPGEAADQMPRFLQAVQEPVARQAVAYLKANAPDWPAPRGGEPKNGRKMGLTQQAIACAAGICG